MIAVGGDPYTIVVWAVAISVVLGIIALVIWLAWRWENR